jgi:predicted nucleic acid-binding protein
VDRVFLDTNIWVYADDSDSPEKQAIALKLIEECFTRRMGVVSTQVLQEYFTAATRKLGVSPEIARRKVELIGNLEVAPINVDNILAAIDLQRLHGQSFWDALILQSALSSGCTICFSEALQHGRNHGKLKIVNPFRELKNVIIEEKQ